MQTMDRITIVTELIVAKLAVRGPVSIEECFAWTLRQSPTGTSIGHYRTALDELVTTSKVKRDNASFILAEHYQAAFDKLMAKKAHPGFYEHYKSKPEDQRLYLVDTIYTHSETGDEFVGYIPLYGPQKGTIRPLELFLLPKLIDGQWVTRFRYLGQGLP